MGCQQVRKIERSQSTDYDKKLDDLQQPNNQLDSQYKEQNQYMYKKKLRKMSDELTDQGKHQEAFKIQNQLLNILRHENNIDELVPNLIQIGETAFSLEDFEKAFQFFREVLDYELFCTPEMHKKSLSFINQISESLLRRGKLETALLYKKEVLNYSIFFFGKENNEFATQLCQEIEKYEKLYTEIWKNTKQDEKQTKFDPECIICCQQFQNEDNLLVLRCEHAFHSDCICKWFQKQQNCPCCRSSLVQNQY